VRDLRLAAGVFEEPQALGVELGGFGRSGLDVAVEFDDRFGWAWPAVCFSCRMCVLPLANSEESSGRKRPPLRMRAESFAGSLVADQPGERKNVRTRSAYAACGAIERATSGRRLTISARTASVPNPRCEVVREVECRKPDRFALKVVFRLPESPPTAIVIGLDGIRALEPPWRGPNKYRRGPGLPSRRSSVR
jgi:hypothetical protein